MREQGRFKYSLPYWCLASTEWNWAIERICDTAKKLGILSLELVPSELLRDVRQHGLGIALANNGMPDPPSKGTEQPAVSRGSYRPHETRH